MVISFSFVLSLYSKNKIWQRRREGIDQINWLRFSSIEKISLQQTFKRQCVRLFKKQDWCKYKRQMEAMNNFANISLTLALKLTLNFKNLGNSANTWTNNNTESMHNIMKMFVGGRICLIYISCVCLRIVVSNT